MTEQGGQQPFPVLWLIMKMPPLLYVLPGRGMPEVLRWITLLVMGKVEEGMVEEPAVLTGSGNMGWQEVHGQQPSSSVYRDSEALPGSGPVVTLCSLSVMALKPWRLFLWTTPKTLACPLTS